MDGAEGIRRNPVRETVACFFYEEIWAYCSEGGAKGG
jgi:uncharacterized membrane protein